VERLQSLKIFESLKYFKLEDGGWLAFEPESP
jgi:hypothetical protein